MRPDYCPLWNEPCQKGCDPKCGTMNAWEALRKENERLRARVALLEPVASAARIYYRHYMQDEADDGGEQWCGHDQHERAKAVRDSLHDLEPFTPEELRL